MQHKNDPQMMQMYVQQIWPGVSVNYDMLLMLIPLPQKMSEPEPIHRMDTNELRAALQNN
jgi:hypothetical protein